MLHRVLMICLLSGMRAGEAIGLEAEDVIQKGHPGLFFHVRPNSCLIRKTQDLCTSSIDNLTFSRSTAKYLLSFLTYHELTAFEMI